MTHYETTVINGIKYKVKVCPKLSLNEKANIKYINCIGIHHAANHCCTKCKQHAVPNVNNMLYNNKQIYFWAKYSTLLKTILI